MEYHHGHSQRRIPGLEHAGGCLDGVTPVIPQKKRQPAQRLFQFFPIYIFSGRSCMKHGQVFRHVRLGAALLGRSLSRSLRLCHLRILLGCVQRRGFFFLRLAATYAILWQQFAAVCTKSVHDCSSFLLGISRYRADAVRVCFCLCAAYRFLIPAVLPVYLVYHNTMASPCQSSTGFSQNVMRFPRTAKTVKHGTEFIFLYRKNMAEISPFVGFFLTIHYSKWYDIFTPLWRNRQTQGT